jgi:hypothetical protein
MNTAIIMQHILDEVETNDVSLVIDGHTISRCKQGLEVTKKLGTKLFTLEDPDCAKKVVNYLKEPEDTPVCLCMDEYFRSIGKETLRKILRSGESIRTKYNMMWEASVPAQAWNLYDFYDYYIPRDDEPEFIEFEEAFLEEND